MIGARNYTSFMLVDQSLDPHLRPLLPAPPRSCIPTGRDRGAQLHWPHADRPQRRAVHYVREDERARPGH
eukprot:9949-Chlamydomonas_euryale.AAC.2